MAILKEKHNCWRICHADRLAFLIDGAAYFEALADTVNGGQNSILIAAWDIDGRIRLLRRNDATTRDGELGEFLNLKAEHTPGLQIYILNWDFPMLYLKEREWQPIFHLGWKTHRRIHYHLDDQHPIGASQHQKFAVVDQRVAFCGGFDLSNSRWDTPRHRIDDPRRKNPDGEPYGPFHDIQMIVEGEVAGALGELFQDRWQWATGKALDLNRRGSETPWPENLTPDLRDIPVAISRTLPAYKSRVEVREVEKLYTDSIAAAQKFIYMENQYLTSAKISGALEDNLSQKEGPEIVLVLPRQSSGWLEQSTMDSLRTRNLKNLFKTVGHQRLRVYYPVLDDGKTPLYIHTKLLLVDDQLALIGSANASNRSMGFDSECNLAVEAGNDPGVGKAIANLRHRLLAEHLGSSVDHVSRSLSDQHSMIKTIESLSEPSGRRLENLEYRQSSPLDGAAFVQNNQVLDPEAPIEFDRMLDRFVTQEKGGIRIWEILKISAVILLLLALAAAWRWTPLGDYIDKENLAAWASQIQGHPLSFLIVLGAYVAGGLVMIPVTLLVGVTAMIYAPLWGGLYALSGCLVSALFTFLIGSRLGKQTVRKLAGKRLNRFSRKMARQGIWTVVIIRNIPIAPFTVVNLIAGASHIKLKDYLIGTAVGMLPGVLAVTVFADRLLHTLQKPGWINGMIAAAVAIALIVGNLWAAKRLGGIKKNKRNPQGSDFF